MSRSTKPRKPYRPKLVVTPLGMRNSVAFEMPGFQASMALGQPHFAEQHVYDLISNADLTRRIAPDGHQILPIAQGMLDAAAAIQQRAAHTGKLGVTGDELRILRDGVGKTMDFLRAASNVEIARAAAAAVAEFNRTGVLRV
jgi:hypothetical protein